MGLGYIKVLEITNSYQSDNIDILHATSDIENIDEFVKSKNYSVFLFPYRLTSLLII